MIQAAAALAERETYSPEFFVVNSATVTPAIVGPPLAGSYDLTTHASVALASEAQADWKNTVEVQIGKLTDLQAGWDSYDAPSIDLLVVDDAKAVAAALAEAPITPPPSVVPTVNGTIQLEWHTYRHDVELEVMAPGRYYLFLQPVNDEPSEGETGRSDAIARILRLLND